MADHILLAGCYGVQGATDDAEVTLYSQGPADGNSGLYRDDLIGQVLKDSVVIEARRVELAFFHSKGVWTKQPSATARQRTSRPPIIVRWVDVNKGMSSIPTTAPGSWRAS